MPLSANNVFTQPSSTHADNAEASQIKLRNFATIFVILYGIYYIPIDSRGDLGPVKLCLMFAAVFVLVVHVFRPSKAMIWGTLYLAWQFIAASFSPDTFRWSTLFYSVGLVYSYACLYNLIYILHVFTIDHFLKIIKGLMLAYFVVCILQQVCLWAGLRYFPLINLCQILDRGIGCNSLSMEPSTFARFMLVFYYAYVKCSEYKRNQGPFSIRELFSGEHRGITIRFLWMMLTMGSGTAFGCLIAFSCYFIRKKNFLWLAPMLLAAYFVLPFLQIEQLQRATSVINAVVGIEQPVGMQVDQSGLGRIAPLLNSLKANFSQAETWLGHGIDYAKNNNLIRLHTATLFDDYGVIFYILSLILNFTCAYRFFSLATLFMFMGVGGGSGGNIQYAWELMIIMTCIRYFYDEKAKLNSMKRETIEIGDRKNEFS